MADALPPEEAYQHWSAQYDTNDNKTRDLEALALQSVLASVPFKHCLELGCGTGKNTAWLAQKAQQVLAVDLTEAMLEIAKNKVQSAHVRFQKADLLQPWTFAANNAFDLVTFSLVLEHLPDLGLMFRRAAACLRPGGWLYVGELHPYKQYLGSKARFETAAGTQLVECYTHHLSDFWHAATAQSFGLHAMEEHFDGADKTSPPRILTLLFQKK